MSPFYHRTDKLTKKLADGQNQLLNPFVHGHAGCCVFLAKQPSGMNSMCVCQVARLQVSPGTTTVSEDSPLIFSTVQLYVPTM